MEREKRVRSQKIVMLTWEEFIRLVICIFFDVVEFAFPFLLGPILGDILDIAGFWFGILMFGWIGCLTILEILPFADYFPIFIITWFIWYYRKKRRERREWERIQKKWM